MAGPLTGKIKERPLPIDGGFFNESPAFRWQRSGHGFGVTGELELYIPALNYSWLQGGHYLDHVSGTGFTIVGGYSWAKDRLFFGFDASVPIISEPTTRPRQLETEEGMFHIGYIRRFGDRPVSTWAELETELKRSISYEYKLVYEEYKSRFEALSQKIIKEYKTREARWNALKQPILKDFKIDDYNKKYSDDRVARFNRATDAYWAELNRLQTELFDQGAVFVRGNLFVDDVGVLLNAAERLMALNSMLDDAYTSPVVAFPIWPKQLKLLSEYAFHSVPEVQAGAIKEFIFNSKDEDSEGFIPPEEVDTVLGLDSSKTPSQELLLSNFQRIAGIDPEGADTTQDLEKLESWVRRYFLESGWLDLRRRFDAETERDMTFGMDENPREVADSFFVEETILMAVTAFYGHLKNNTLGEMPSDQKMAALIFLQWAANDLSRMEADADYDEMGVYLKFLARPLLVQSGDVSPIPSSVLYALGTFGRFDIDVGNIMVNAEIGQLYPVEDGRAGWPLGYSDNWAGAVSLGASGDFPVGDHHVLRPSMGISTRITKDDNLLSSAPVWLWGRLAYDTEFPSLTLPHTLSAEGMVSESLGWEDGYGNEFRFSLGAQFFCFLSQELSLKGRAGLMGVAPWGGNFTKRDLVDRPNGVVQLIETTPFERAGGLGGYLNYEMLWHLINNSFGSLELGFNAYANYLNEDGLEFGAGLRFTGSFGYDQ